MTPLCIIPARSGSKRLPGKNWMTVGGKTLVERAVECAIGARLSPVIVSDMPELANLDARAQLLLEPAELAADTMNMLNVVQWARGQLDRWHDPVLLLQPTSPLRAAEDVIGCIRALESSGCDSVVSVVARNLQVAHGGVDPFGMNTSILHGYERNGAVYLARAGTVDGGALIGGWTQFYVMPPERSVDVDTEADLIEARRIAGD